MVEQTENVPLSPGRKPLRSRPWVWVVGILAGIALLLYTASFFIDEPLRKLTEKQVNRDLKGYSVRIPELHLQLIGLSLTLKGLTVTQQGYPKPTV